VLKFQQKISKIQVCQKYLTLMTRSRAATRENCRLPLHNVLSYPRTLESPTTPLWKPPNSHSYICSKKLHFLAKQYTLHRAAI